MGQLKEMLNTIRRKPAAAPDGRQDDDPLINGVTIKKNSLASDIIRGGIKNASTVAQAVTTIASGKPLDDKELLLEHGVAALQSAPPESTLSSDVSDGFIKMLWNDLPHPSVTVSGPTARYRRHDGGGNNPWLPEMGKAGTPYARNVPPVRPKGQNLPDPTLVFEQLLRREDGKFREHPSGLNRLFFSFATIVIHECFQTSRENQWINETSSYVDLSTLYGNTDKEQPRVRTYKNGLIYPDSIASERIMMMPPGVVAVLILFSRNHNSIAETLFQVNEAGKYQPWDKLNEEQQKWQDEDIFQITRNINVGFFAQVVMKDYVAAILNTPRANSTWSLDLGKEIKGLGGRIDRGGGNVVSVEFAVLYHWHAALSAADANWMEGLLRAGLPDLKSMDELTPAHFYAVAGKSAMKLMATPAKEWTFNGLKRGPDGRFKDEELADLIKDCIDEPAHAFGHHGTPASLRVVDIMGMLQARNVFNVCTLNEFRAYLNLKPYESFKDWCEDDSTAHAAQLLYGHINNLELYPGLMAECTKPPMPGSGVCPGQTTGRGILDDAVSLVRGDRFLSFDMTSNTLTNWGVSKLGELPGGAYGGMLPKLLFRGLPGAWTGTSSYALLPFYTPKAVQGILKDNGVLAKYDTKRPKSDNPIISVHSQAACKQVWEDRANFRVMYQAAIRNCTDGHDFMIGWDDAERHDKRSKILHAVFFEENHEANITKFFDTHVESLIKKSSLKYIGSKRSFDVVRDVTNVTPILWLAEKFAIPLKTDANPRGLLSIPQLFDLYLVLFMYQSFNILPENEWLLRDASLKVAPVLRKIIETHLKTQQGFKEKFVDKMAKGTAYEVGPVADRVYHALNDTKLPIGDLVGDCIGMGAPVAGNITQQASLLINLYLSPGYEQYKERIIELSHRNDKDAERELQGFCFEGMRHAGVVPGLPRIANKDITIHDGERGDIHIKAEQTVLIASSKAAMDPAAFPEPEKLNPLRPFKDYTLLGHGLHFCFGARLVGPSLAATLRQVFKLPGIRKAPGPRGQFITVSHEIAGGVVMHKYLGANANESPIPTTLTLEYDEGPVAVNGTANGVAATTNGVAPYGKADTVTHGAATVNGDTKAIEAHANGVANGATAEGTSANAVTVNGTS